MIAVDTTQVGAVRCGLGEIIRNNSADTLLCLLQEDAAFSNYH